MKRISITSFLFAAIMGLSGVANGSELFITSVIDFDPVRDTITMPLLQGSHNGSPVWYIVTESSDQSDASARGVNFSPKLRNALGTVAVQKARILEGEVEFPGTVDFSPERVVEPGPTVFPPSKAQPGSIGDAKYSPLVTLGDGIVLNASQVANGSGRLDSVLSIDFNRETVTLGLARGFYNGKPIRYIRTESSDPTAATLEASTFAPNLNAARGIANNERTSARSGLFLVTNGPTGVNNPERQGLTSALLGEGPPLNVLQTVPKNSSGSPRYSPLWDVHPGTWTDAAIASGARERVRGFGEIKNAVQQGLIVSAGSGPANPELEGLRAGGFIVNCPFVAEVDLDE